MRLPRWPHALLVTLALVSTGCAYWDTQTAPVPQVLATKPTRVRIFTDTTTAIVLAAPTLSGDSVRGTVRRDTVAIPLARIRALEVRKQNSSAFMVGIAVAALVGILGESMAF